MVRSALGDVGRIVSGDSIRLSLPKDVLLGRVIDVEDGMQVRQMALLFILLVLGGFMVALSGDVVHLWFLPSLRMFSNIPFYDWGSLTLATLYSSLDAFSRCCR